jgi:hypothetical protein
MAIRSESRKKTKLIQVRVTPEEKVQLKTRAADFGVSVGELCRRSIFSAVPKSLADQNAIQELAALRADLGRMGGLFKGWLAGSFPQPVPSLKTSGDVIRLRRGIEATQKLVVDAVNRVSGKVSKP